jgi:hypothetical protein
MAPKIVFYFVVLLFLERFHDGNLDVMISLFLSLCKNLRIDIMFVVLFVHGAEWCELWSRGSNATTDAGFEIKHIDWFCVDCML